MSTTPLEWKKSVIDHYGSIAAFHDVSTVEIMRSNIATKRADLKVILDTRASHPGVVDDAYLADVQAEDDELANLDAELADWQAARKAKLPV